MNNASVLIQNPPTSGEVQEIYCAIIRGAGPFMARLRGTDATALVGRPGQITDAVSTALLGILPKRVIIPSVEVERWQRYYRDEYGITHSFEGLEIPVEQESPTRLIVMHADVSNRPQRIATVYKKRCNDKWLQYADDLDVAVPIHNRSGTYAIRVADVPEAPDGLVDGKNLSTQQTLDRAWNTTTLPERLVDGDVYLKERKEHLDRTVITLCPGSRTVYGYVPSVRFHPGNDQLRVSRWSLGHAVGYLRFRRAIV